MSDNALNQLDYDMIHLNNDRLAVIDVITTGPDFMCDEIVSLSVTPVNSRIEPRNDVLPFSMLIKPNIPPKPNRIVSKELIINLNKYGNSSTTVAELFVNWCENYKKKENKGIQPICYDWGTLKPFLVTWLGVNTFDSVFPNIRYRDLISVMSFINDSQDKINEKIPFIKAEFSKLGRVLNLSIEDKNSTQMRCLYITEVYRKILNNCIVNVTL